MLETLVFLSTREITQFSYRCFHGFDETNLLQSTFSRNPKPESGILHLEFGNVSFSVRSVKFVGGMHLAVCIAKS